MITTGSKYFFGIAAFALVAALVYGVATSGHELNMDSLVGVVSLGYKGSVGDLFGYSIFVTAFGSALFLGSVSSAFRDADPEAEAQLLQLDSIPETAPPQGANYWPVIAAFGATSVLIGVVVGAPLVILGVAILGVSAFEWAARAWSERLTGDPAMNRAIRNRVLYPVEIPLLAVVGIAVMVLSVSRVLLALPKVGSYVVFGSVPALILGIGWLVSSKPKLNRNVVAGLMLVLGAALLTGGVISAAVGPHPVEEHDRGTTHQEGGLGVPAGPTDGVGPVATSGRPA